MTSPSGSGVGVAHRCPVPDCPAHCSPGHVACRRHWLAIPKAHRGVLAKAFRVRTTDADVFTAAVTLTQQLAVDYSWRAA
jgi:hypothetical protein